jgi:hypothetical protein
VTDLVARVDVGALAQEQGDHVEVSVCGGEVEGGAAALVLHVELRRGLTEQETRHGRVTALGRQVQRDVALEITLFISLVKADVSKYMSSNGDQHYK